MRYALSRMGSTVFAGAVTTVGAGFFLYCAQTAFNQNVGFVISFTITISLIYTLFFFSSLCILFGPHGNAGDICCCCPTRPGAAGKNNKDKSESDANRPPQMSATALDTDVSPTYTATAPDNNGK